MFDPSAPHMIILLAVVLLLFGSSRLPGAAQALGKSMRIFKSETKKMHSDDEFPDGPAAVPAAELAPPVPVPAVPAQAGAADERIADLQRQISELHRQNAGGTGDLEPERVAVGLNRDPAS
jgi:sec-independent protein translocase protein TatA